jgi:hypothetical protein
MSNLVTKLVDICQGDAATENMLLDEIKRSPVVTELKVFDKDPYERVFCTKTEALVIHSTNGTHIEKMNKEFDGSTDLSTFRLDIYGRTRDYDGVNLSDYTMGSLVGFNIVQTCCLRRNSFRNINVSYIEKAHNSAKQRVRRYPDGKDANRGNVCSYAQGTRRRGCHYG